MISKPQTVTICNLLGHFTNYCNTANDTAEQTANKSFSHYSKENEMFACNNKNPFNVLDCHWHNVKTQKTGFVFCRQKKVLFLSNMT